MAIKHFSTDGVKAACGAKGCYVSVTCGTYLVECSRCERSKAYKAKVEEENNAQRGVVKA